MTEQNYEDALRSFVDQSMRVAKAQQEVNRLTAEAEETQKQIEARDENIEAHAQELALAKDTITRLRQEINDLQEILTAMGHQEVLDRETIEATQRENRELRDENTKLKQKVSYWRAMFEDEVTNRFIKLQAEYDLLKELETYYRACSVAGYSEEIASTFISMADMMADRMMLPKYEEVEK